MPDKKSVEITIPVYNEEADIKANILRLYQFCQENLQSYYWHITIADNASQDKTAQIGLSLEKQYGEISYVRFNLKGRGRAVKEVWLSSKADICSYMDVDLSTNLSYLPKIIKACFDFEIAIGSRLISGAKVLKRSLKRELISRTYNLIVKILFQTRFSDAQCGFKAVNRKKTADLLSRIQDNHWFFDTELLIVGEKSGYSVFEQPVIWTDNPGSTVRVLPTAFGDLQGLIRLFFSRPWTKIKQQN